MTSRRYATPILLLVASFLLSSCGVVRRGVVNTNEPSNPEIYVSEVPSLEDVSVEENAVIASGIASWYGPNFHGRRTANGEIYNMEDMTAAHKTLPFNTVVRVVNLDNGRSIQVRINDRGPYVGDRIIDLSRRAAREIDMIQNGTTDVQLFLIREGDRPLTSLNASSRESFTIQLASFDDRSLAEMESMNINGSSVEEVAIGDRNVYRVIHGIYDSLSEAEQALAELIQRGYNGFVKQIEN